MSIPCGDDCDGNGDNDKDDNNVGCCIKSSSK